MERAAFEKDRKVDVEEKKGVWVREKFQEMTGTFSKLSSKWKKEKSYLDNVSEWGDMTIRGLLF